MRLWKLLRRKRREEELDEEIQHHLAVEIEERIRAGMRPEEAECSARPDFGNQLLIKDVMRDAWGFTPLVSLAQDIRYGLRILRRNPGFTTVVILTLALGIGMNTAMFSVVKSVLFNPVAYPNSGRLVWLGSYDFLYTFRDGFTYRSDYVMWKEQAQSFENMTAYGNDDLALVANDQSSQESIASITGDFWKMAGAQPALGRLFRQGEPDAIVISYGLFERRFGNNPNAIGKVVTVNGYRFNIIGVLPKRFRFLFPEQWDEHKEIDAYIPIPDGHEMPDDDIFHGRGPELYGLFVVGKLKPNVPFEKARAEMQTIYDRIAREYPFFTRKMFILQVKLLKEKLAGNARRALMVLLAAVGFVLLIASANIANLLLARASTRQREIAIRAAVGAGRARVIKQFLAERALLALLGAVAGLVLARWALALIVRLGPAAVPGLQEARVDGWVLAFALAVSLSAAILFGLGPALASSRTNLCDVLKDDTRTSSWSSAHLRIRGVLVSLELALAIVLLAGAGLMLKSLWRMNASPPGFAPEKILSMRVALSGTHYAAWPAEYAYIREMLRRLETTPGVLAAGIHCATYHIPIKVVGLTPTSSGNVQFAEVRMVSSGYLRAMGAPLDKGHWPSDRESLDAILVNESFARTMPGADLIGKHIGGSFLSGTIVGVVADFKYSQLDAEPSPEVYYPYERSPGQALRIGAVVRTPGNAMTSAAALRKRISDIDRTQPVYEVQTLEQTLSDSIAPRRFNMLLLEIFAATALFVALVGVYGVIAYSVAQRRHEIGIRMALGASRAEIVRMVVLQGMSIAGVGLVVGLGAALGLTHLMASLLYDVTPNDPVTFALVTVTLAATALLACAAPAFKAALMDPGIALRCE